MTRYVFLGVFVLCSQLFAQPEEEDVYASSCSLSVKTNVYPAETGASSGRASIEVTLCEQTGVPIPNQQIRMTASSGTFSCIAPEALSSLTSGDRSCFITGSDGKILVYLVDIPFNRPGVIKASCTYGEFNVHASGRYHITRSSTKKKGTKPSSGN